VSQEPFLHRKDRRQGHGRAKAGLRRKPNQGLELTGNSVRSCVAPAIPRSSGLAFGPAGGRTTQKTPEAERPAHNRDHPRERPSKTQESHDRGPPQTDKIPRQENPTTANRHARAARRPPAQEGLRAAAWGGLGGSGGRGGPSRGRLPGRGRTTACRRRATAAALWPA
jgi:hypothetical protein